jgi:hypothetical protein
VALMLIAVAVALLARYSKKLEANKSGQQPASNLDPQQ